MRFLLSVMVLIVLPVPVVAGDGLLGITALYTTPALVTNAAILAKLDTHTLQSSGLLGVDYNLPAVNASMPVAPVMAAGSGLMDMETIGSDIGLAAGPSFESSPAHSDPWATLKLDEDADRIGRRMGIGYLLPDITVITGYNDNYTFENNQGIGSYYTKITPHSSYVINPGRTSKIVLDLQLEAGLYEASSEDDYLDHRWRASYDYNPTRRIFASAFAEFLNSHDARGKGRAEGGAGITQDSLDEWRQWGMGGRFAYGVPGAKGRLEFDASYKNKTYETNRLFTFTRDREDYSWATRFFYRVMPKTYLLIEGTSTILDYQRDAAGVLSLDGTNSSFLTGVTWRATYKTTGFAKIGYNIRTFDERDTDDGLSWALGVDWAPKTYSTVHLETSRSLAETNGTGDVISTSNVTLAWNHHWKQRFSTTLDLGYQSSTFDPNPREDKTYQFGFGANYAFRRWLNLGAVYRYSTQQSSDDIFDYDQNIIEIRADLLL